MPLAVLADFNDIDETSGATKDWPEQWGSLRKIIQDLAAVWHGQVYVGTEPDTGLQYFYFGDANTTRKRIEVGYDGTNFSIRGNTGTDGAPVWINLLDINRTTQLVTIYAGLTLSGALSGLTGLTLSGDLDLDSNDILNVANIAAATLNGWDPDAHAARHAAGAADGLLTAVPVDIGAANAEGAATTFARSNHVHEGVHQIVAGTRVSLSPAGGLGDVTVNVIATPYSLTHNKGTGDQAYGAINTEQNVTGLTGLSYPDGGADGSKWYEISGSVLWYYDANDVLMSLVSRVYSGVNGNLSDGAGGLVNTWPNILAYRSAYEAYGCAPFGPYPIQPGSGHKIGVSAQCHNIVGGADVPQANTTIKGSAGLFSYIYIKRLYL